MGFTQIFDEAFAPLLVAAVAAYHAFCTIEPRSG